jgi:acetylglutamate kinase
VSRFVVKVGGAVAAGSAAHDLITSLAASGREIVVVHGGGPQITAAMAEYDLPVEFVHGRRVTTPAALVLVRRALADVNASLCATIGPLAVGLLGDEIGLRAQPVPELGRVGTPLPSSPPEVLAALARGRIPVVAPLAAGPLNVNADEAAAALAVGLDAERLLFLSDVPGLLRDGAVVPRIAADEATRMLDAGELEGGIVPKLRAAVAAARQGVTADIGETAVVA